MRLRRLFRPLEIRLLACFIALIAADQSTKTLFASRAPSLANDNSLLSLLRQANQGVIGGFLSDLNPAIGRIFFSVLGIFLVIFAGLIIYFLKHKETPRLKWSIALFSSGLISNVFDRSLRGEVIDFIALRLPDSSFFVFNVADMFVASGFGLFSFAVFSEYSRIWFENNTRKSLLIDRPFQLQYTKLLVAFALMQGAVIFIYSYAFLSVYVKPDEPANASMVIHDYLSGIAVLELCFVALSIALGILFSHRAAGPLYSFQSFFERWREGIRNGEPLEGIRLRKTDHFKMLEKISEEMSRLDLKERD